MQYEGSPALWHIIIMPFAKLGFPYITINLVHFLIIYLAAAVFVYKSPFSKTTKILFIFSYFMAWEYSIIARNYAISVLLLFIIAAFYQDRLNKPFLYAALIFLLLNTNIHSFFIAIPLVLIFLFEIFNNEKAGIKRLVIICTVLFGSLLAFIQLLPTSDDKNFKLFVIYDYLQPLVVLRNAWFPYLNSYDNITLTVVIIILIGSCIYLYNTSRKALFILILSYLGLFYIFIFKHNGGYRHHGFILITLLFVLWISSTGKKNNGSSQVNKLNPMDKFVRYNYILVILLINCSLAISIIPALTHHYLEYNFLHSGSKLMANYLENNKLTNNIIVAHRSPPASALLPYLPGVKFWYADIERYGTFITWGSKFFKNTNIPLKEVINRINKNHFPKHTTLLLLSKKIPENYDSDFRLLHKIENGVFGRGSEKYYLYGQ